MPPPGMYLDPDNPNRQRFWNGHAWTDHVTASNDSPDAGPAAMYAPLPSNPSAPPPMPSLPPAPPTAPPPFDGAYAAIGSAVPYNSRPMSQAAIWSIIGALLCPLLGLICGFVALSATSPSGDRRGRTTAIVGLVLCALSMAFGLIWGLSHPMESLTPSGTSPTF